MKNCCIFLAAALSLAAQTQTPPPDAKSLVQKAFSRQDDFFEQARNYTYLRHEEVRKLDRNGKVNDTETTDHEVTILYGEPYRKLLKKNGRALSENDARKEQEKMNREIAKRSREIEKRRREAEKEREEQRKALAEAAEAFDWRIEGQESLAGRPAWVLRGTPRADYKPKSREAKIFSKMSGRIWIDRAEPRMVKADAVVDDTISWGWFLLRIKPGFRFTFQLARIEDSAWLPKSGWLKGEAKVGGLKTIRMEMKLDYTGYRRFQSDSRILSAGQPE